MFNMQAYQAAFIEATQKIKQKEHKGMFYITKSSSNPAVEHKRAQGEINHCPHLRPTPLAQKNPHETASYTLAEGKKASDAILSLINDKKAGCSMTCQMASQLSTYYAILKAVGVELFDKMFTDTFPLILRDFAPKAGQPFISAPLFTGCRASLMTNVAAHPLALFMSQAGASPIEIGDTVIFANVPQYDAILNQAVARNERMAKSTMRRMEALCISNAPEPLFYHFGTMSDSLNQQAMAQLMADAHNANLQIVQPKAATISAKDVLASDIASDQYHYRINDPLLDYFMTNPNEAIKNLANYKKSLEEELKVINKLPAPSVPLRQNVIDNMSANGKKWRQEKNYSGAISAYTAAASESLRGFTSNQVSINQAQDIANLFHELAITHELAGSTVNALRFARMAQEIPANVGIPPSAEHVATLDRMTSNLNAASFTNSNCKT